MGPVMGCSMAAFLTAIPERRAARQASFSRTFTLSRIRRTLSAPGRLKEDWGRGLARTRVARNLLIFNHTVASQGPWPFPAMLRKDFRWKTRVGNCLNT
jgi:hypothetical protein